tara:strand:- start:2087 stop:3919 length:1833 start_codon:yes stop_codon:yes gene_type:complete
MGIIKQSYRFLTAILLLTIYQSVFAQISDTSNYFNHEVKKGETSFGIAKQYKIDLNLFFDFNPSASDGIKKGEILKIPVLVKDSISQKQDTSIKKHKVIKGETLWSIAKIYGVEVDVIKTYNQLNTNELKIEQVIFIPNILADTNNIVKPMVKHPPHPLLSLCDTLIIHKVKRKETLYGIANTYGVPLSSIIKTNPILEEKGLQKDMEIKIVYKINDCDLDSLTNYFDTIISVSHSEFYDNKLVISLLLPFQVDESDSLMANGLDPSYCYLSNRTRNSMYIYNGISLALDELKKKGYQIDLNVYDTKYDTNEIKNIIQDSTFKNSHLIIGPIYSKNIKLIRGFSRTLNIPMITPFDIPNQALFRYPNMYKFFPSKVTQSAEIGNYLKAKKDDYNIILVSNKEDKKSAAYAKIIAERFLDTIAVNDSVFEIDSLTVVELTRGKPTYKAQKEIDRKKENLFVVAANDIPFLTYVFNDVLELSNSEKFHKSSFTILSFQKIFDMSTIDIKYKNQFNIKFSSSGMIDYNDEFTLDFINNYQEKFSMIPHENSFLGYDLLNSMINAVYPVESDNSLKYVGHYNNSDFQQIGINNGFENKVVKLFEYSDFTLKELK